MTEQMIDVDGVVLCAESFGERADPCILLIHGLGASMLWWDERFCRLLADGGRFVVRYDHRDTGRSVASPPGRPDYGSTDLVADVVGVLDAFGIESAHLVGVSAGGAFAQVVAVDASDRVRSLVLISTTPALPGDRHLPGPSATFLGFARGAEVDWGDTAAVVDHLVGYSRVLDGGTRVFDEDHVRGFVALDLARTRNVASLQNHDVLADGDEPPSGPLSSIRVPTLVIHGSADPLFPIDHGERLAAEIPGADLLTLDGAGHGVFEHDWPQIVPAILDVTSDP